MDDIAVIHISSISFDSQIFFDVVIYFVWIKNRTYLRHLAAQSQTDVSVKAVDKVLCKLVDSVILDHISQHLQQNLVVDGSKVITIIH